MNVEIIKYKNNETHYKSILNEAIDVAKRAHSLVWYEELMYTAFVIATGFLAIFVGGFLDLPKPSSGGVLLSLLLFLCFYGSIRCHKQHELIEKKLAKLYTAFMSPKKYHLNFGIKDNPHSLEFLGIEEVW